MKFLANLVEVTVTVLALIILVTWALNPFMPYDDTDWEQEGVRSGLSLYIDYGTGCHYIKAPFSFRLEARVDSSGRQVCRVQDVKR